MPSRCGPPAWSADRRSIETRSMRGFISKGENVRGVADADSDVSKSVTFMHPFLLKKLSLAHVPFPVATLFTAADYIPDGVRPLGGGG